MREATALEPGHKSIEWHMWKKAFRIYPLVYVILITILFVIADIDAIAGSARRNVHTLGSQIAGIVITVLFIPVIVFLFSVDSSK